MSKVESIRFLEIIITNSLKWANNMTTILNKWLHQLRKCNISKPEIVLSRYRECADLHHSVFPLCLLHLQDQTAARIHSAEKVIGCELTKIKRRPVKTAADRRHAVHHLSVKLPSQTCYRSITFPTT